MSPQMSFKGLKSVFKKYLVVKGHNICNLNVSKKRMHAHRWMGREEGRRLKVINKILLADLDRAPRSSLYNYCNFSVGLKL